MFLTYAENKLCAMDRLLTTEGEKNMESSGRDVKLGGGWVRWREGGAGRHRLLINEQEGWSCEKEETDV